MSEKRRKVLHGVAKIIAEKKSKDSAKHNDPAIKKAQDSIRNAALNLVEANAQLQKDFVKNNSKGAKATATLLGVPLGKNPSFLDGPAFAPSFIREALWSGTSTTKTSEKNISHLRVLADVGDIPIQVLRDVGIEEEELMEVISDSVNEILEKGPLYPIVLGGDESVTSPVVKAMKEYYKGPVDILRIDAHPDLYEKDDPCSAASIFTQKDYVRKLVKVRLRPMTEEEESDKTPEDSAGVKIEQYDIQKLANDSTLLDNLAKTLGDGNDVSGVYISIDVGSLNPNIAPRVSHYEYGGLVVQDILKILASFGKNKIIGADVVEYNPKEDDKHYTTATVAAKIVKELAAKMSKS